MDVELLRARELRQAHRGRRASGERGPRRQPHQLSALDRDPAPRRRLRHPIVGGGDRRDAMIEQVHRDLDAAAAGQGQAQRLHGRQPAAAGAHLARDRAGGGEIVAREPDVVGDEDTARADEDGPAARIEARGSVVGTARLLAEARGQPLVLAVAQLAQRASFGTPRRLAVVVDGQRVARRERRPHRVREGDGHAHRGVRQGHERQNVERADAGMDAAMLAHVDLGQRRFGQRDRAGGDGGGLAEEREDRAMVIGVGEDAAVIDLGDRYLVATADPITFATDDLGWYALHVNANDIVVRGATPRWFLATLLLPARTTDEESVRALFAQLAAACEELEVALVGGHTEVTHGLDRAIVAGTMLGEVAKDKLVTTGGARVGDAIVLTKGVPLEGAAIIARQKEVELRARGVPAATIRRAKGFLRTPGISVRPEAELACELASVHAMHDPTEGGIATALHELADAAGVGLRVDRDRIL